jgi:hypothetical protein
LKLPKQAGDCADILARVGPDRAAYSDERKRLFLLIRSAIRSYGIAGEKNPGMASAIPGFCIPCLGNPLPFGD